MITCAIYGCSNSTVAASDPTIQYYYFPKHPTIAQQWISACWRADPIDLSTARICSIHFEAESYTSEYKMIDYLGGYTRMLKYDAVPTLYLPNPHASVIIKSTVEHPANTTDGAIHALEVKEIMVYEVCNLTEQHANPNYEANSGKDYTESNVQQITLTSDVELNMNQEDQKQISFIDDDVEINNGSKKSSADEKYGVLVNQMEFEQAESSKDVDNEKYIETEEFMRLKQENISLKQEALKLEETVRYMQTNVEQQETYLKNADEELKKLTQQCDLLQKRSMTLTDQKNVLSKVFSESQLKILSGKKKIYWSNDDMAVGYTIRHLSNKRCYLYLSKHLNIPLPALSSIKRWATLKKTEFEKEGKKQAAKFEEEDSD